MDHCHRIHKKRINNKEIEIEKEFIVELLCYSFHLSLYLAFFFSSSSNKYAQLIHFLFEISSRIRPLNVNDEMKKNEYIYGIRLIDLCEQGMCCNEQTE